MRRTFSVVAFTCVTLGTLAAIAAPDPVGQSPVRDGAAAPVGTGFISGVVLTGDTTTPPVRRAVATLRDVDRASTRSVTTDEAGRFAFDQLPSGRFTITVAKPAFVTVTYGAKARGGQGLSIALVDGQRVTGLAIKLLRGAVVTGRIVDERGRPAANLQMQLVERVLVGGVPTNSQGPGNVSGVTDDRGTYRIYGLSAGTYLVTVSGGFSAFSNFPSMPSAAEVQWARGGSGTPGTSMVAPPKAQPLRDVTVYYPGTTEEAAAVPITLAAGEERNGLDFVARRVPAATVTGTVSRSDGQPPRNVQIFGLPKTTTGVGIFSVLQSRASVDQNGHYSLAGLAPGSYVISARGASGAAAPAAGPGGAPAPGGRGGAPPAVLDMWAVANIEVIGENLSNVNLTLAPGMTVSGRVVIESSNTPNPPDITAARVNLFPPPNAGPSLGGASMSAAADGTFKFSGITPGEYRLMGSILGSLPANPTWVLKSATVNGEDVLDRLFEIQPGVDVTDLTVTFSDQISRISGSLTDQAGRPAPSYFVIVFPTDPKHWVQGGRRLRPPTRPATDGTFSIAGLPAGEYYMAALLEFGQMEWYTPGFLQLVAPSALKITLTDGEKKTQDIRLQ